jgi:hypothetical protein
MRLTILLTAAVCLAVAASASAAGTLDQQQTAVGTSAEIFGPSFLPESQAQTFTAGLTGGLDRVDLSLKQAKVGNSVGLTVQIRTVSGGVPGAVVLASATIAPGAIPAVNTPLAFVPVTFGPPAPVVAGTQYAIVVYTGGSDQYCGAWPAPIPTQAAKISPPCPRPRPRGQRSLISTSCSRPTSLQIRAIRTTRATTTARSRRPPH